jgi:hypothetical protein
MIYFDIMRSSKALRGGYIRDVLVWRAGKASGLLGMLVRLHFTFTGGIIILTI